jgi:hypothetical protein
MLRAIALIGLAGALAGCDFVVQKAEERAGAEIANAAGSLGEAAVKFDLKLPPELLQNGKMEIAGVPMVAGGTITGVKVDSGGAGEPKINLSFNAPTSPEQVKSYFLDQFRQQSVEAALVADAIQGVTKDGSAFTMRFAPEGTGTSGTIELNPKR